MNLHEARPMAELLILDLYPAWARMEIAGSIRRGKLEVKDIELVAVPLVSSVTRKDLFGETVEESLVDLLDQRLRQLVESGRWQWELDPDLPRNGPRYKRFRHRKLGVCLDLFITDERGWGGAMAIRTGPADFSQALVTLARQRGKHVADGYLIHGHPKPRRRDGRGGEEEYPCSKGSFCPLIVPTLEETDFFAALGLPHWDPASRTAEMVWKKAREATR